MEEKMHWLPTSIGMMVIACIFGGMAIAIYPGWSLIGNFFKENIIINWDQNAPAWVQAIGSVLAIFSAVAIAWWQRQEERRHAAEDRLRTAIIASWEMMLIIQSLIRVAGAFLNVIEEKSDIAARVSLMRQFHSTLSSAIMPSDSQILRLDSLPDNCAIMIAQGVGRIKHVQHYIGFTLIPHAPTREASEKISNECMADVEISKQNLDMAFLTIKNFLTSQGYDLGSSGIANIPLSKN